MSKVLFKWVLNVQSVASRRSNWKPLYYGRSFQVHLRATHWGKKVFEGFSMREQMYAIWHCCTYCPIDGYGFVCIIVQQLGQHANHMHGVRREDFRRQRVHGALCRFMLNSTAGLILQPSRYIVSTLTSQPSESIRKDPRTPKDKMSESKSNDWSNKIAAMNGSQMQSLRSYMLGNN